MDNERLDEPTPMAETLSRMSVGIALLEEALKTLKCHHIPAVQERLDSFRTVHFLKTSIDLLQKRVKEIEECKKIEEFCMAQDISDTVDCFDMLKPEELEEETVFNVEGK